MDDTTTAKILGCTECLLRLLLSARTQRGNARNVLLAVAGCGSEGLGRRTVRCGGRRIRGGCEGRLRPGIRSRPGSLGLAETAMARGIPRLLAAAWQRSGGGCDGAAVVPGHGSTLYLAEAERRRAGPARPRSRCLPGAVAFAAASLPLCSMSLRRETMRPTAPRRSRFGRSNEPGTPCGR